MGKTQRDGHGTPEPNWLEFAVWCFLGVPFVWLIAMVGVLWVIVAMSAIAMHNGSAVGVFSIGIIVLTILVSMGIMFAFMGRMLFFWISRSLTFQQIRRLVRLSKEFHKPRWRSKRQMLLVWVARGIILGLWYPIGLTICFTPIVVVALLLCLVYWPLLFLAPIIYVIPPVRSVCSRLIAATIKPILQQHHIPELIALREQEMGRIERRPLIIAHRGASEDAPENTLAAFGLGWEQGADGLECDVHVTADGTPVCIHDDRTWRVGDKDRTVAESNLEELRGVILDDNKRIPTLAEVLENRPDGKTVLVEIKSGPDSVASICEVIEESRISFDDLRIMSFSEDVLHEVKKCQPYVRCLWLVSGDQVDPVKWWKVVKKMVESDFAGIACDHRVASEEFATDVRRLAREFHVWTVNTSKDAALVRRCGARSIITNRPAEMRRIVEATYRFKDLMNSPDGLGCRWGLLAEREQLEEKARENVAKEIGRLHP